MKKYKLIKTYPGSPDLGYVTKEGVNDGLGDPKDYPEFWKELIEPEYVKCIRLWNTDSNFTVGKIYTWPQPVNDLGLKRFNIYNFPSWKDIFVEATKEEYEAQNCEYEILFTTEDGVPIFKGGEYWYIFDTKPTEIIHVGSALSFKRESNIKRFSTKQAADEHVAKHKVLFVTEDGVEIRADDSCYEVTRGYNIHPYIKWRSYYGDNGVPRSPHFFSTEEKAQEYIELNKPKYSINQIKEAFRDLNLDLTVAIRICVHIANTDSK